MTKFCPACGEKLADNAKFCKNCGINLETQQQTQQETQQTIDPAPPMQQYQVPKAENDHKIAVILGYVLALLIPLFGLIIGIYLLTRKDSESASFHGKIILAIAVVVWFISFMLISS
ncbi:zinc-ribbon domain-containing protein [Methanobrevibacter sp.]|uniref:zinc-ribbon domain-containing protein n=1 Tax=Methanobrevibacter sp. TaxID=66852 RepID=UPI00388F07DF